jgi:gamma-glutamyltranspeptidase / glutathione hydrolase
MQHGIVTAGHEKTAEVAIEILKTGGNAFDAIIGGGFAACVAESVLASLGGGGFLLGRSATGQEMLYDFFVHTPRHRPDPKALEFYPIHADFGPTKQEFHIGLGAVATPGMIAGFFQAHRDMGRLPFKEVLAPAIRLCRDGVTINAFQEYLFTVVAPIYLATEESRAAFGSKKKPGSLVLEGETLKFPELAQSLDVLAQEGPDLFYRGEAAKKLVEQCQDRGTLRVDDLTHYQVSRRKPLEFFYRGHRLLTNPPPSCGGILIAFSLELLDQEETADFIFGTAADLASLARAMDQTNLARMEALGKNRPWDEACATLTEKKFIAAYRKKILPHPLVARGTTHLNVSDGEGNVASLSLSNGEGCGHLWRGTGIMLNNMLGEEDLNPSGFNHWQSNRRMASMMAPTILLMKDGTTVATGSGGSNRLRTAIVQVLKNLIDHRMPVPDAVEAPRIHFERGLLSIEPGFSPSTIEKLLAEFPQHHLWEEKNLFFGGVHTLASHPKLGFSGSGDPRRFGVCFSG